MAYNNDYGCGISQPAPPVIHETLKRSAERYDPPCAACAYHSAVLVQLYLYSHEKLLRPLQGMSVPLVIGAYTPPEGGPFIAMEPLHGCAWSGADSTACEQVKRNVLHAYTQLHSRGILHGSVKSQHVIYSK